MRTARFAVAAIAIAVLVWAIPDASGGSRAAVGLAAAGVAVVAIGPLGIETVLIAVAAVSAARAIAAAF